MPPAEEYGPPEYPESTLAPIIKYASGSGEQRENFKRRILHVITAADLPSEPWNDWLRATHRIRASKAELVLMAVGTAATIMDFRIASGVALMTVAFSNNQYHMYHAENFFRYKLPEGQEGTLNVPTQIVRILRFETKLKELDSDDRLRFLCEEYRTLLLGVELFFSSVPESIAKRHTAGLPWRFCRTRDSERKIIDEKIPHLHDTLSSIEEDFGSPPESWVEASNNPERLHAKMWYRLSQFVRARSQLLAAKTRLQILSESALTSIEVQC